MGGGVPAYSDALDWGGRERWLPGERAWFEYHCYEGHDSADAQSWYRSHQAVEILSENDDSYGDGRTHRDMLPTQEERAEEGMPVSYRVRYDDGYEWTAIEDELLVSPSFFERPDPPAPR